MPEKRKEITYVKSIRLDEEIHERVATTAETLGRSQHAVILQAIRQGLPAVEREAEDWKAFQAKRAKDKNGK